MPSLKINSYFVKPFEFINKEWFKLTKINYSLLRRSLFSEKKGEINTYFPLDLLPSNTNLLSYYIAIFEHDENNYDSDYEMGFNNFDSSYEHNLVYDYFAQFDELYCIVAHLEGKRFASDYSLFNNRTPNFIEKNYNILHKGKGEITEYIVKINHKRELLELDKFIAAYCICPYESKISTNQDRLTPLDDIGNIIDYTRQFKLVIPRAKIYANHNLVIYSHCNLTSKIESNIENFCNLNQIEYNNYKL